MASTALFTLAAFNLICTGTNSTGIAGNIIEKKVSTVMRVDLDAKRWCSGDCASTVAIKEVTPFRITFNEYHDSDGEVMLSVNRETGEFLDVERNTSLKWIDITKGTCAKSEFTGFPKPKF